MSASQASTDRDPIAVLLSTEKFTPIEPRDLDEAGLPEALVEALILKRLLSIGMESGRGISEHLCLVTLKRLRNATIPPDLDETTPS